MRIATAAGHREARLGYTPQSRRKAMNGTERRMPKFASSMPSSDRFGEKSRRREQSEAGQHYTPLDHRRDVLGGEEAASISDRPSILSSGLSAEQEAPAHGT